jgi:hypothetical protein
LRDFGETLAQIKCKFGANDPLDFLRGCCLSGQISWRSKWCINTNPCHTILLGKNDAAFSQIDGTEQPAHADFLRVCCDVVTTRKNDAAVKKSYESSNAVL